MENVSITYNCAYGKPNDSSACGTNYQIIRYGESGEIIHAVCSHGFVVIDRQDR